MTGHFPPPDIDLLSWTQPSCYSWSRGHTSRTVVVEQGSENSLKPGSISKGQGQGQSQDGVRDQTSGDEMRSGVAAGQKSVWLSRQFGN